MRTILVVDDAPDIRVILSYLFQTSGFHVIEASDGQTALQLWRTHHPDVVITDILMPQLDGLQLIQAIRSDVPRAKIVAISGASHRGDLHLLEEARRLGAARTFSKPFDLNTVLKAVQALVGDSDPSRGG